MMFEYHPYPRPLTMQNFEKLSCPIKFFVQFVVFFSKWSLVKLKYFKWFLSLLEDIVHNILKNKKQMDNL